MADTTEQLKIVVDKWNQVDRLSVQSYEEVAKLLREASVECLEFLSAANIKYVSQLAELNLNARRVGFQ